MTTTPEDDDKLSWDIDRDGRMADYATDDDACDDLIQDPTDEDRE